MKGLSADVGSRNAAPFIHRHLYRDYMPQSILSCFTANALYANRTAENTAMVMRVLRSSVRELVDTESVHVVATPTEKLARAQALFLYQIICLFDGDIGLRAQGERDLPLLQAWLEDLCRVRDNLGDAARLDDSARRDRPPKEWEVGARYHSASSLISCSSASGSPGLGVRRVSSQDHRHGILCPHALRGAKGPRSERLQFFPCSADN